ncbi:Lecithin retinol acyltransferase-like protein [Sarcoptes scabiei]|uniref:Lecithin retinol acyltransferase-like protein n=1 Tax=Sarcoptes scabiei TaxID=52283 RepID=A0A132A5K3_SARSC|nr:Lecithin retinol acyltransferase-like protein [Sarcoptes scabiei]
MIKFANVIGSAEATLSPSSSTSSMDDRSLDPNSDEVQVATEAKELINVCDEIKNRRLDVSKRRDSGNNANVTMQATPRSAIAIEVPPNTLKIDLLPFKAATEVHPEPGDIIEFDRTLFSQWAIYVGDGDVVVIVATNSPESEIANVQRAPMIVVARENFCRVNNKLLRAKERNLLPFHNEIVVRKALSKVSINLNYSH